MRHKLSKYWRSMQLIKMLNLKVISTVLINNLHQKQIVIYKVELEAVAKERVRYLLNRICNL